MLHLEALSASALAVSAVGQPEWQATSVALWLLQLSWLVRKCCLVNFAIERPCEPQADLWISLWFYCFHWYDSSHFQNLSLSNYSAASTPLKFTWVFYLLSFNCYSNSEGSHRIHLKNRLDFGCSSRYLLTRKKCYPEVCHSKVCYWTNETIAGSKLSQPYLTAEDALEF